MAQHYSSRQLFRQISNPMLDRYFKSRGLFNVIDFSTITVNRSDKINSAWLALPAKTRNILDSELREIFSMCSGKGTLAIIDAVRSHLRDTPHEIEHFIKMLSKLPSHGDRAMFIFLDHDSIWKSATRFHHADSLSYWRKRRNLRHIPASVDKNSIDSLAALIGIHFNMYEGRGSNCKIEYERRNELDYFFCFPEDHARCSVEWINNELSSRPHNPAFEVVYAYSEKMGELDLNFRGAYQAVEPLQWAFATTILKLHKLPPDPEDHRVYNLNLLRSRDFGFNYAVDSGIDSVAIKKMRLSSRVNKGNRISLEADVTHDPKGIYGLLDIFGKFLPLDLYNVTQVELKASVIVDPNKPPKSITFRITYPQSCSLDYDEIGLKLRGMLAASGIEPSEPANEFTEIEDRAQ